MAARILIAAQTPVGDYPVLPLGAGTADLVETAGDATNGHYTPIVDGKTYVVAHNTGVGARTVTFASAADDRNRKGDITAYSLAAGKISLPFGPFRKLGWSNVGPDVALTTSAATDDIIDTTGAHGLAVNDAVKFTSLTGGTGLVANTTYYVVAASFNTTTFRVAATRGGAALGFSADITAGVVVKISDYLWIDVSHAEVKLAVVTI
jgi:hypothetical protein